MEINLRNVPFSEELVFFIRRCAGESGAIRKTGDFEVRVSRTDIPTSVYEVRLVRRFDDGAPADVVIETDPDAFLAVRNAFEILKGRDSRELILDVTADAHS